MPNVKKKDRLKSEPNAGTSSSETSGQQENLGVEEIELKLTTTEEERRFVMSSGYSSPLPLPLSRFLPVYYLFEVSKLQNCFGF